jgi:hypothetical protein
MATRNLYEMEDVCAHLLYSLAHADAAGAAQAANELRASEEDERLFNLLTLAWMLAPPGAHERAIADGFESRNAETMLHWLARAAPYESPAIAMAAAAAPPPADYDAPPPPPTWMRHPADWTPNMAGALWRAVSESLRKRNADRAFRLTAQLIVGNTASLVDLLAALGIHATYGDLLLQTIFAPLCARILYRAFVVAVAPPAATQSVPRLRGAHGRDFTISVSSLSAWSIQPKPVSRLIGAPLLVVADDACAFWRRVCRDVRVDGDNLIFPNDDACEEFFGTYFPNDIPDEWSVKERAKSHGLPAPPQPTQKNPWIPAFLLC